MCASASSESERAKTSSAGSCVLGRLRRYLWVERLDSTASIMVCLRTSLAMLLCFDCPIPRSSPQWQKTSRIGYKHCSRALRAKEWIFSRRKEGMRVTSKMLRQVEPKVAKDLLIICWLQDDVWLQLRLKLPPCHPTVLLTIMAVFKTGLQTWSSFSPCCRAEMMEIHG